MTDKELAFWKWYTKYGLNGTHSEGKSVFDVDYEGLPNFKANYDDDGKIVGYYIDDEDL